jgi:DNA invertase Pin-like site-specific DNA recombinase
MTAKEEASLIPLEDAKEDLTIKIVAIVNEHLLGSIAESNDLVFEQKYNQGAFPYKAPIGYIKNTKDKEGKLKFPTYPESYLLLDTDKMWIVHEVFNKMAQGEYYKDICKELKINSQTLYDIVRNKTYLGMTHYGNEWKKSDAVPQVIAQEIFDKANQNIKVKK